MINGPTITRIPIKTIRPVKRKPFIPYSSTNAKIKMTIQIATVSMRRYMAGCISGNIPLLQLKPDMMWPVKRPVDYGFLSAALAACVIVQYHAILRSFLNHRRVPHLLSCSTIQSASVIHSSWLSRFPAFRVVEVPAASKACNSPAARPNMLLILPRNLPTAAR